MLLKLVYCGWWGFVWRSNNCYTGLLS